MELKHLRTFQAVVDQGSYQRAAESLNYTQSTVTAQIQQLESALGVPLFERVGRRMRLTEAGNRAMPQVLNSALHRASLPFPFLGYSMRRRRCPMTAPPQKATKAPSIGKTDGGHTDLS